MKRMVFSTIIPHLTPTIDSICSDQTIKMIDKMPLAEHQKERLVTFINPEEDPSGIGYQVIFFLLLYRMILIALSAPDDFSTFFITGAFGMFSFQFFENIGMNLTIMPVAGN